MKFYILGASGFIGSHCVKYLESKNHTVFSERIDITNFQELTKKFNEIKPDVVINFAGVRAYPTIDWCEGHKEETVMVNVVGAINVCMAAKTSGAYPIQISSGCIYSGNKEKSFTEEDEPNFFGSFYSRMRIVTQNALKELPVLQMRIRMPISMYKHPRNLITKLISYNKVISVPNSVTLLEDLFPAIEKLCEIKPTGILNMTNDGYLEHKDILETYKKIVDDNHSYELINVEALERDIVKSGRSNCLLSNAKLKSFGIEMPALDKERLEKIMVEYKKSL